MRIRTALLIVVGLIVAVVVGGVVVLLNLDFNAFKDQIAAEAKKATGRDLAIKGDLKLNLFTLSPGLAVEGVHFANAPWGSRKEMARINRFEVKIEIVPLFSGEVEVKRIVLTGADILIERDKRGRVNYEFEPAATKPQPKAKKPAGKAPADKRKGMPVLSLRDITIRDAKITYIDAAAGKKLTLQADEMGVRGGTSDPLELVLKGSYNGAPIRVNGRVGALAALVTPGETPWPVAVTVEAGGASVNVKGTIKKPAEASGLDLRISVEGKDLSALAPFAGGPVPPLGPYSVAMRVLGSPDRSINLRDLVAKVGESGIRGRADLTLKGKPRVTAALSADLIALSDFVKSPPDEKGKGEGTKTPKSKAPAAKPRRGDRVFPSDPLPVDGLKAADATVDLTIKKLLAHGVTTENVEARLSIRDGNLKLSPFGADLSKGKVTGAVQLDGGKQLPELSLSLKGERVDIGKLLADLKITDVVNGAIDTAVDVKGHGKSVAQIMAGLNGRTEIVMGKGRMRSDALEIYGGKAASVATQALFGKQSEYTVINCFVNRFEVRNGIATSKAMLFDTDHATIWGSGTVNLGTERIDYAIDPRPKSATITTSVPVKVGGTLADPSFKVNPLATAAKVTGLVGSILGKKGAAQETPADKPVAGDANLCVDALKPGAAVQPKPAEAAKPAEKVVPKREDVEKEVKKTLEKGLKSLFGR